MEEDDVWKCRKHPKRRSIGVCPICVRDRLVHLCPDCANVRPCSCSYSSSSSSSSSSFCLSSSTEPGITVQFSDPVDYDPALLRSRSTTFSFTQRRRSNKDALVLAPPTVNRSKSSLWPVFKYSVKKKKSDEVKEERENLQIEKLMMMRSKSIGLSSVPESKDGKSKGRRWFFPSSMKLFRQSKTTKVVRELSPMCRG